MRGLNKISAPFLESFYHSKKLSVVSVVISFGGVKSMGEKFDWMEFARFILLG